MSAIRRLRCLANDIDWHVWGDGSIPRKMRSIADEMEAENNKLKELAKGLLYCLDDHLDAHDCPLYDEGEPNKCKAERLIREAGVRDEDS